MPVVEDGVLGIADDEEHVQVWTRHLRRIRNLSSSHPARQAHVGHEGSIRASDSTIEPGSAVGGLGAIMERNRTIARPARCPLAAGETK